MSNTVMQVCNNVENGVMICNDKDDASKQFDFNSHSEFETQKDTLTGVSHNCDSFGKQTVSFCFLKQ